MSLDVVIAGGTGLIGQALCQQFLEVGAKITILTRQNRSSHSEPRLIYHQWDGQSAQSCLDPIQNADIVINLAGESILQPWTQSTKDRLWKSRIDPTKALVDAMNQTAFSGCFISASAIGYYDGSPLLSPALSETDAPGQGFMSELCQAWEAEANKLQKPGRVIIPRLGIVLDQKSLFFRLMHQSTKFYLGAVLGTGKQWINWIHLVDVCRLIQHLSQTTLEGVFNLVSPHPCQMKSFIKALGHHINRPVLLKVPSFLVRLAGKDFSDSLLKSPKVVSKRIVRSGYQFSYPDLERAIRESLSCG